MAGAQFNPNGFAGANATSVTALAATGGGQMNALDGAIFTLTPTATQTLTAAVTPAGTRATIIVLTSGTSSFTQTFGTGFKSTGTLATGITGGAYFVLEFVSNGTLMIETSRTAAM
jgi:hypothetical protein